MALVSADSEILDVLADLACVAAGVWREGDAVKLRIHPGSYVGTLVDDVERHGNALLQVASVNHTDSDCVVPLSANTQPSPSLVCIHAAHGSVHEYRFLPRALSSSIAVYGVHALGSLLSRDEPAELKKMAEHYASEILRLGISSRPFALFGISAGGLISLECSRFLEAAGHPPKLVILGDTLDPHGLRSGEVKLIAERFLWLGFIEAYMPHDLLDVVPITHGFWKLAEPERFGYMIERVRQLEAPRHLLPLNKEILCRQLEKQRKYLNVYSRYEVDPYSGRVLYLRASAIHPAASRNLRANLRGAVRVAQISGNHLSIFRPPALRQVARHIEMEFS